MAGETVIELGTAHGVVDEDAPRPARSRRAAARARLAAASAVLVLLCGAAAPAQANLRRTATVPGAAGASASVAGDLLVIADPTAPGGPGTTVTAYALRTGTPRWTIRMPVTAGHTAEAAGDVVLIAERDPLRRRAHTTAVAREDGAVRWRRPGAVVAAPGARIGLVVSEVRSSSGPGRRVEGGIEAVDLATGRTRWTTPVPSTAVAEVVAAPAVAVVVHDSGRAEVRDLATGGVWAARTLPPADYAPDNPRPSGGTLVLRHPDDGRVVLTGYDLATLHTRWRRPAVTPVAVRWEPCGDLLCARTPDVEWTLDPATGGVTRAPGAGALWRTVRGGGGLVVRDLDADRLLFAADAEAGPRTVGVLPAGYRDCRDGGAALVCRAVPGGFAVFRLPGGAGRP